MELSIFLVQSIETLIKQDSTVLGPCISGRIGTLEYDEANCFVSDFWPPCVSSWIDRCHSWPLPHVVDDIVRTGCHFVPKGHKLGKHADKEWRISFFQAEQKTCVCNEPHPIFNIWLIWRIKTVVLLSHEYFYFLVNSTEHNSSRISTKSSGRFLGLL